MKRFFSALFCAILFCGMVMPAHAATSYPDFPEVSEEYVEHVVVTSGNGSTILYLYRNNEPFTLNLVYDVRQGYSTDYYKANPSVRVNYTSYKLSGETWSKVSDSYINPESMLTIEVKDIQYSTLDIMDKDGNLFFQAPPTGQLYQIIQKLTNQEMTKTQVTVVGVMKILALCGVGCLALLVVLKLFGKVLPIFRA